MYAGPVGRMWCLSRNMAGAKRLQESHQGEKKKRSKKTPIFSLMWIPVAERFWKSGATPLQVFNVNVEVLEISL